MSGAPGLQIVVASAEERSRVMLAGELDMAAVEQVEGAVEAQLEAGARELVLDLAQLSFIDSSGVRLLLALDARAAREGWALTLARPAEQVRSILRITGIDESLPLEREETGAG